VLVSVADVWLDAKLNVPRMTPTEQRAIAPKARRLKKPDCEAELFCIGVGLSSRSAKRHRRTFLVSNFSSPMEAFYAIENRLSSIFPVKDGNPFCSVLRFVLRIGRHRPKFRAPLLMNYLGGIISTNRYIALLLAVGCHSHRLLQSANTGRGAAIEGYPRFADSTGEGQY